MKIDGIIFDIDGTLLDAVPGVTAAWNEWIEKTGYPYRLTVEMMKPLFGQRIETFGDVLFSDLSEKDRHRLAYDCQIYQVGSLRRSGLLQAYYGVRDTLIHLAETYPLFIVTNADEGYVKLVEDYMEIGDYIRDYECDRGIPGSKADNIRLIIERNGLKNPVYVGDTSLDKSSTEEVGIPFIWASYGLEMNVDSKWHIDNMKELPDLLNQIKRGMKMFREVRKKSNEISVDMAKSLLKNSRRGVFAVNGDDGYPYAIPINYFYDEDGEKIYFHGARVGHKVDALKKSDKICFTVYGNEFVKDPAEAWAPYLQSAVVFGRCHLVEDYDEAMELCKTFAMKYYPTEKMVDDEIIASGKSVQMFVIDIEYITGKQVQEI